MSETLHFIVTEDSGRTYRLPFSKRKFQVLAVASSIVLTGLVTASCFSLKLVSENHLLANKVTTLESRLSGVDATISDIERSKKEQNLQLSLQVANLELAKERQESLYKEERQQLISAAVNDLKERSEIMEAVIGGIGIKIDNVDIAPKNNANSGGPYIAYPEESHDQLLIKADKYVDILTKLPIGRPTAGSISSPYGKRNDPLNSRSAFHAGTDFRGKRGAKIYATGDGVVKKAFVNGSYGNYVLISHGNGYTTSFAHMKKFLVQKGDRVKRGQLIGFIGNTGRSTGPHLHYEIHLNNRPINPKKFLAIKLPEAKKIAASKKKKTYVQ